MLLLVVIITYILSNIVALALVFTGKKINAAWLKMLSPVHLLFGLIFLFSYYRNTESEPVYLSFLFFFCSGILLGGLALGTRALLAARIYFGIFCASIFVFIVSPSTLLRFLVTASFSAGSKNIAVAGNYFLEPQSNVFQQKDTVRLYKLTRKTGMFHKALSRDLDFHGTIDSIRVLSFESGRSFQIRGYTSRKNFVESNVDSVDLTIDISPAKPDEIEYRL